MVKRLDDYSRSSLECYMVDCHSFEKADLADWESKQDLVSDIKSFGWEAEALEYLA